MTDVNTLVADPSAATAEAAPTEHSPSPINLSELTKEQRQSWRDTGKLPEPKKTDAPAASTTTPNDAGPAAADADDTSDPDEGESAPAPEAGKQQEQKPKGKLSLQDELRRVKAENKRLKQERTAPVTSKTVEASTTTPAKTQPKAPEAPVAPKIDDKNADGSAKFKTFEELAAAEADYIDKLTDFKVKAALQKADQERAQKASEQVLDQQVAEARKQYDDFDTIAGPVLTSVMENAEVHLAVKQAINNSPVLPHLLYGLGGNQQQLDNLVKLSKSDPIEAIKRLGAIEDLVIQELAKARAGVGKDAAASADGEGATPPKKDTPAEPITRIGKPPSEVGGRGTSQEDPAVAAARSGDVRGAFSEWNRKAKEGSIR